MKLRTPSDILEAVPYLLGFEPTDCLVALALHGRPRRLGMTLRVDVPDDDSRAEVVAAVVTSLRSDNAECVVLVGYAGVDAVHLDRLVGSVRAGLATAGVPAPECLRVVGDRWTSYLCSDTDCCPAEGKAVPDRLRSPSAVGSMAVVAGRQVLADRAALAATIAPVRGLLRDAMAASLQRELGRDMSAAARTVQLVADVLDRSAGAEPPDGLNLTVEESSRILVGLLDVTARDACLDGWQHVADEVTLGLGAHLQPRLRPGAERLWTELVRRAVAPGLAAPVATLLAWNRYVHHGGGAIMTIALERALNDDPDYFMALALQSLLDRAVPPERFADLIAGPDVRHRRRPGRRTRRSA